MLNSLPLGVRELGVGQPWPAKLSLAHVPVAAAPSCGERSVELLPAYSPGPFAFQTGVVLVTLQWEVCHVLSLEFHCLNTVCHMV